ncbi:MAG: toxic anion resistance protein [Candidatus Dormibacteraeota bacterium]|nr:toxic anion resistance protein [Candidatus Dormibacteraeota bacterium]
MSEKQPESTAPQPALVLEPPKPVVPVTTEQAATSIEVPDETARQIATSVQRFVDELSALDVHSSDFQQKVDSIHQLGNQEIRRSSEVSNRFLERPAASLEHGIGGGSGVSQSLVALRRQVEDLDPSRQDGFEHKILGIIPFGDGIRDYFHKYQSAQHNLDAILQSLYRGQDELQRDTVAIEQEKVNIWALKGRLEQYAYMAGKLDEALTAKIAQVQLNEPEKARSLQEDVLFYVRQKRQDLLTQLAVNLQGYLALDLVRKNDQELIKGVDRATTTTVSALRTAIIVSEALTNQKLVLDQVTAVNTTTSNLIESTSELLREQSGEIQNQAASTTIGIEKLQTAFNNIYATMDMIDQYKLNALDTMQQTVNALSGEVQKAQTYVERTRQADAGQARAAGELTLPEGDGGNRAP